MKHLRKFTSLAAFESEKASLPRPSVSKVTDGKSTMVYWRLNNGKDVMHTVGSGPFLVGWSVLNGKATI